MVKHFYSYIVETDTIFLEIDSLEVSNKQKEHLKSLAESHIHQVIIDSILSELEDSDKKMFLLHLNTKDHARTWKFLNSIFVNAEEKIKEVADLIHSELIKDVREAKS